MHNITVKAYVYVGLFMGLTNSHVKEIDRFVGVQALRVNATQKAGNYLKQPGVYQNLVMIDLGDFKCHDSNKISNSQTIVSV